MVWALPTILYTRPTTTNLESHHRPKSTTCRIVWGAKVCVSWSNYRAQSRYFLSLDSMLTWRTHSTTCGHLRIPSVAYVDGSHATRGLEDTWRPRGLRLMDVALARAHRPIPNSIHASAFGSVLMSNNNYLASSFGFFNPFILADWEILLVYLV